MHQANSNRKAEFRLDINGLRAFAVLGVVLYHFNVAGFDGGFAGVDVFFVISGFLMTGIIARGLANDDFSTLKFLLARGRRIVPTLAVVCVALLIVNWLLLSPQEYSKLGKEVGNAISFGSNILFLHESGYFDVASQEKWLLHTWSLSVEWQFYLLLPIAAWVIWQIKPKRSALILFFVTAGALSLGTSVQMSQSNPTAAFFLIQSRCWELLAGGLVFLTESLWPTSISAKRVCEWLGVAMLAGTAATMRPQIPWPGYAAILPVLGTALIIGSNRQNSILTSHAVWQRLGDASYSIYLWHWPIAVTLAYFDVNHRREFVAFGIIASLLAGILSHRLIEQPTRRILSTSRPIRDWSLLAAIFLVTFGAGRLIDIKKGFPVRGDARVNQIFAGATDTNPRMAECHVGPPKSVPECKRGGAQLGAIVIGDSHSESIMSSVQAALGNPTEHVLDWSYNSCPTLMGVKMNGPQHANDCGQFIAYAIKRSHDLPSAPLIILNRTSSYLYGPNDIGRESEFGQIGIRFEKPVDHLTPEFIARFRQSLIDTVCRFSLDRQVYLVRPIPELRYDVPRTMGRAALMGRSKRVSISMTEYEARHKVVWDAQDAASAQCGAKILNPLPYLCRDGQCWGDQAGVPLYYDDDHLNEHGGALLTPMFKEIFPAATP